MEFIVSDCEDLKCGLCRNYLSYFPINTTKDGLNICGRCEIPLDDESDEAVPHIHNKVYEVLAKDVRFPCQYANEGCTKHLLTKDVPRHEESCRVRLIDCPASLLDLCDAKVSIPKINNHCKEMHADLILKDSKFKIDLAKSAKYNHILFADDECFVVEGNYDAETKILNCTLYEALFTEEVDFEWYKLSLKNKYTTTVRSFCTSKAPPGLCGDIDMCLNFFEFPNMDSTVVTAELLLEETEEDSDTEITKTIAKLFECSRCCKLIRPPVEMYLKDKKFVCSKCVSYNFSEYVKIQTDTLDNLATTLCYPCQYNSNGCNYNSSTDMLEEHEILCPFQIISCPLNCNWKGMIRETILHVDVDHSNNFVSFTEFKIKLQNDGKYTDFTKLYIIKVRGFIFRIYFGCKGKSYYWSVQMVGGFHKGFRYNIEIYDKLGRQLSCTKLCTPLKDIKSLYKDDYCSFTFSQFAELLDSKYVRFRVRVF